MLLISYFGSLDGTTEAMLRILVHLSLVHFTLTLVREQRSLSLYFSNNNI